MSGEEARVPIATVPGEGVLASQGDAARGESIVPRLRNGRKGLSGSGSKLIPAAHDGPMGDHVEAGRGALDIREAALQKGGGGGDAVTKEQLIDEWPATALAGNDLMSSCLYSIGLVTRNCGCLAPLAFLAVALVLYLYRGIYAMAVLTFPHNGGSYNLLANVAPKHLAALGGCLSIISYIATCVVAVVSACTYLAQVFPVDVEVASCILLVLFAMLVLTGLKESTAVAFAIFVVHIVTLLSLCVGCAFVVANDRLGTLQENLKNPLPAVDADGLRVKGSFAQAAFLGFSTAMLGVSGFETSAQFVESMHPGVFVKTLRNLWAGVTFINPVLSFLSIAVLPLSEVAANSDTVLAKMALVWGKWVFGSGSSYSDLLAAWMAIDAFIVLAGSVLTAFVGADGLLYQLAVDRCLPSFFVKKNKWRGTNHYIILTFLALCLTLVVLMRGKVDRLAGVYSIAFLGVMGSFALGAMLLQRCPKHAPTLIQKGLRLPWWHLTAAFVLVMVALVGNFFNVRGVIESFFGYFVPIYCMCLTCLYSDKLPACLQLPLYLTTPRIRGNTGLDRAFDVRGDEAMDEKSAED